jgi:type II pantothenate kinase
MISTFNFTGGKSFRLFKEHSKSHDANLFNEFEANTKGIEYLYLLEKSKPLKSSLIVTMGTGTSIILKEETFTHIGGSAMGGGFFMGMLKLVLGINNFQEAITLAKKGNRYNVDLKVSDIYDPEDNRIDLLFREFTAATLGKIELTSDAASIRKEDFIMSLICLIGENLGTIASLAAEKHAVENIVFSGGFLKENRPLRKIISLICNVNKKRAIFLKNSEYSAAIGAMLL